MVFTLLEANILFCSATFVIYLGVFAWRIFMAHKENRPMHFKTMWAITGGYFFICFLHGPLIESQINNCNMAIIAFQEPSFQIQCFLAALLSFSYLNEIVSDKRIVASVVSASFLGTVICSFTTVYYTNCEYVYFLPIFCNAFKDFLLLIPGFSIVIFHVNNAPLKVIIVMLYSFTLNFLLATMITVLYSVLGHSVSDNTIVSIQTIFRWLIHACVLFLLTFGKHWLQLINNIDEKSPVKTPKHSSIRSAKGV